MVCLRSLQVYLNPQAELPDMPLKSFYRYSLPDISLEGQPLLCIRHLLLKGVLLTGKGSQLMTCIHSQMLLVVVRSLIFAFSCNSELRSERLTARPLYVPVQAREVSWRCPGCPRLHSAGCPLRAS